MNHSTEVEQPYEGQKFESFDALKKYLEEYGQRNFVKFWIRSSHTRNSIKSKISRKMNPDLKYVSVKFACIFGGEKIRCRGSGIRQSSTYRNLGCPCMINAVVGEDGNHVKLDTVILEHNHILCKTLYDSLKKTKRKSQTFKNCKIILDTSSVSDNLELELIEDDVDHFTPEDVCIKSKEVSKNQENVNNLKKENVSWRKESDPAESCLKNIKDKYGGNVKILVVDSENSSNLLSNTTKCDESDDEDLGLTGEEDAEQLPELYGEICRLCLSSENKLSPIFDPDLPLKSTVLSFKIMGCASIEINNNDGLPNNICTTCEATLDIAYNFRVTCENSDSVLRKACMKKDVFRTTERLVQRNQEKCTEDASSFNEEDNSVASLINYPNVKKGENDPGAKMTLKEGSKSQEDIPCVPLEISCSVCGSDFDTYQSMLDHLETHTDDETILFTCSVCDEMCPTMKELQEHMREHLNDDRVELRACPHCHLTFASEEEFRVHEETHELSENQTKKQSEMNYLCNVCGKILKSKDRFQAHKNTHEGLRPYVCLKCGRGFADRKNMRQHYDVVHLRKVKHECPVCQKKFYTRTKMKSHVTMHYGVKPFSCDVCTKTFRLKMNMIKHKKTHSNDRPHQCDKCNAAFIDKNMLKRHSYIHGGIRPYPCPVCGHRFSVKFHLKKHLEKSKCGRNVVDAEDYQWTGIEQQPESNLTENECVVVFKAGDESDLQTETETINMDILQEYNE